MKSCKLLMSYFSTSPKRTK